MSLSSLKHTMIVKGAVRETGWIDTGHMGCRFSMRGTRVSGWLRENIFSAISKKYERRGEPMPAAVAIRAEQNKTF